MSQGNLFEGRNRRDEGAQRVADNNASWVHEMRSFARRRSASDGYVTADDIREHCEALGWWPKHPNAFGAVFRQKGWERIGFVQSTHKTNNARVIGQWKWTG